MARTDSASRVVPAPPDRVFAALVTADARVQWLPPFGMSGRFEWFDARPGGSYRLVLTYDEGALESGKSAPGEDVVQARFVEVAPDSRVVETVDFVSDDPSFTGTMTMTWELTAENDGTLVEIRADDVPEGISPEDHVAGMQSSLANLARFLATDSRRT